MDYNDHVAEHSESLGNDFRLYIGRDYGGWIYWINRAGARFDGPSACNPVKGESPIEAARRAAKLMFAKRLDEAQREVAVLQDVMQAKPCDALPKWAQRV